MADDKCEFEILKEPINRMRHWCITHQRTSGECMNRKKGFNEGISKAEEYLQDEDILGKKKIRKEVLEIMCNKRYHKDYTDSFFSNKGDYPASRGQDMVWINNAITDFICILEQKLKEAKKP